MQHEIEPIVVSLTEHPAMFFDEPCVVRMQLPLKTSILFAWNKTTHEGGYVSFSLATPHPPTEFKDLMSTLCEQSSLNDLEFKCLLAESHEASVSLWLKDCDPSQCHFKHKESAAIDIVFYSHTGRVRMAPLAENSSTLSDSISQKTGQRKVRVLVVDDSPTVVKLLSQIISSSPDLELAGTSMIPAEVPALVERLKPDVMTMDIMMPEMDGVTLLSKIFPKYKIPTIMISSISKAESPLVLQALEIGAFDYIQKPTFQELHEMRSLIVDKLKEAALVNAASLGRHSIGVRSTLSSGQYLSDSKIVAIGSSTGGTETLRTIFSMLPAEIPPIIVVQHIPAVFSKAFADRMNELFEFEVKEAEDGDIMKASRVLIAPGDYQLTVERDPSRNGFRVRTRKGAKVSGHCPSVDVMFESVAKNAGRHAVGFILTGMGRDGAQGLLKMKQAGAQTVAQGPQSCVVYGMPREAVALKAADKIVELDGLAQHIMSLGTIQLPKEKLAI